jgi:hypothetical protein
MYRSLAAACENFHLYVFAFDDLTLEYFKLNPEKHLTIVSLHEFEDEDLLRVKSERTAGEYCWTSTSSTILYCIQKFGLDHCTYIDADMIFYSDPKVLYQEMGERSVLITEHRYTPAYDQSATSGIYCVQYVTFKNDSYGMKALRWWRDACIEWCFNRAEDGKFGDQKYLDDWTTRFESVHVLQHLGGGVAPWNVQQYHVSMEQNKIFVSEKLSDKKWPLVFFHFHGLRFYAGDMVEFTGAGYELVESVKALLFKPYAKLLFDMQTNLLKTNPTVANANGVSKESRPTRKENAWMIRKQNFLNRLKYLLGRRSSFRLMENHLYHRSEL